MSSIQNSQYCDNSSNLSRDKEIKSIVSSLVNELIIKVDINSQSMMSEDTEELDASYYSMDQSMRSPEYYDVMDQTLTANPSIADFSIIHSVPNNDESNLCQSKDQNEKDSSKQRPKDSPKTSTSSLYDWHYSPSKFNDSYDSSQFDYYKSIASKYDNLLDPLNAKKDTNLKSKTSFKSRDSLVRKFDPLMDINNKSFSESPRDLRNSPFGLRSELRSEIRSEIKSDNRNDIINDIRNDCSDLTNIFQRIRLSDSPKVIAKTPINSPKPDILSFDLHETNEYKNQIKELENKLKKMENKNLNAEQELLQIRNQLIITEEELESTKQLLGDQSQQLSTAKQEYISVGQELVLTKQELMATKEELSSTKLEMSSLKQKLEKTDTDLLALKTNKLSDNELSKEKMSVLEEKKILLQQELSQSKQENVRLLALVSQLHDINQNLYKEAAETCDTLEIEKQKLKETLRTTMDEMMALKKNQFELIKDHQKINNEFIESQETVQTLKTQNNLISKQLSDLETQCRHYYNKCQTFDSQQCSLEDFNKMKNELMSMKMQSKKSEMKINSFEKLLDQKSTENKQLSEMVDELISKVGH